MEASAYGGWRLVADGCDGRLAWACELSEASTPKIKE
jgi:hypothetical protein